jgi:hypothetical protein
MSSYLAHNNYPSLPNQQVPPNTTSVPKVPNVTTRPPARVDVTVQPITFEPMLTERQAAQVLNKPMQTLKKWRQREKGPKFKKYHDGAIRYPLAALKQYLEDCVTGPTPRQRKRA